MNVYEKNMDLVSGTDAWFSEIYLRRADFVYRLCLMLLRNYQDAEDAMQWVFLRLLDCEKKFDTLDYEKAWLTTVARNHCRNVMRQRQSKETFPIDEIHDIGTQFSAPSDGIIGSLLKLPEKYRLVLYLRYGEDFTGAEIARNLRMPAATVRSLCSRGLKLLREIAKEDYND